MEIHDRMCDRKTEREGNSKRMIGSVTKNGERREMETYARRKFRCLTSNNMQSGKAFFFAGSCLD